MKPIWENRIESLWNNKLLLLKDGTYRFPIRFDVTYDGPLFMQTVTVNLGDGDGNAKTSMTNWYTRDTDEAASHEFGHMLGQYDEYAGSAVDPANPITDTAAIMGSRDMGAVVRERCYQGFRDWIALNDPYQEIWQLEGIPEPGTFVLVAIGTAVTMTVRITRRRSRRAAV